MCRRAINSIRAHSGKNTVVVLYVDEDDPKRREYEAINSDGEHVVLTGKPRRAGEAIRFMLEHMNDKESDMYYFGSDDITWETEGWDLIFKEKMPAHGLAVLYPDMGDSCNPCFTRKWVETVGLFPDYFKHFGPDTWYVDIAKRAGTLINVPEVRMTHQRVRDDTYTRTRADGDGMFAKRMLDETRDERQNLSEKVRALINADR
jgi:hypothetical protein